jgi:hypothetical protein
VNRLLSAAFITCLVAPLAARAEEARAAVPSAATTQPVGPWLDRRAEQRMVPPWRERIGTYPNSAEPVTDEERAEVEKFMTTYSPKRWEKFKSVRNKDREENILRLMRNQMRSLQRMKTEDPKVYELRLARLPIEDAIFSLGWQIKHGDSDSAPKLRQELHDKVQQFVDNSLREQQLRIDRMQERVRKQQQDLASAQEELEKFSKRKDDVIKKGVADIEDERPGALKDLAGPMFGQHKNRDGAAPSSTGPSAGADANAGADEPAP